MEAMRIGSFKLICPCRFFFERRIIERYEAVLGEIPGSIVHFLEWNFQTECIKLHETLADIAREKARVILLEIYLITVV